MTMTLWQRIDQTGRNLAPGAVTMMLVLVNLVPLYAPQYDKVVPTLPLSAVFYWAIHRPDLLPPSAAFVVGLLFDLLSGAPAGLTALTLVLVHWTVGTQRSFFLARPFHLMWWGFALLALATGLFQWLISSLLKLALLPLAPILVQALFTMALFPPLALLYIRVHKAFLTPPA